MHGFRRFRHLSLRHNHSVWPKVRLVQDRESEWITKQKSPFATYREFLSKIHKMIPAVNFLLEICLAAREFDSGFLCLIIFITTPQFPEEDQ
jgi:hypothetical protein